MEFLKNPPQHCSWQFNDTLRNYITLHNLSIDSSKPVYICEPACPEFPNLHISNYIKSIIKIIPADIIKKVNKGEMLLVFNLIEVLYHHGGEIPSNIDHDRFQKLLVYYGINSKFVTLLAMSNPSPYGYWSNFWPMYSMQIKNSSPVTSVNLNKRDKIFTCLNNHPKPWRVYITSMIVKNSYIDKVYLSFNQLHLYAIFNGYDDESVSMAERHRRLSRYLPYDSTPEELLNYNFVVDNFNGHSDANDHSYINIELFQNAYWNIVTESTLTSPALTEKTFKPIANLQPFIIMGGYKSLDGLRQMGFQTFGDYIDESYDLILDHEERLHTIGNMVIDMLSWSDTKHVNLMKQITGILEHNQRLFFNSTAIKKYLESIIR